MVNPRQIPPLLFTFSQNSLSHKPGWFCHLFPLHLLPQLTNLPPTLPHSHPTPQLMYSHHQTSNFYTLSPVFLIFGPQAHRNISTYSLHLCICTKCIECIQTTWNCQMRLWRQSPFERLRWILHIQGSKIKVKIYEWPPRDTKAIKEKKDRGNNYLGLKPLSPRNRLIIV